MKGSFIQGVVMLYVILMGLQLFVTGGTAPSSTGAGAELYNVPIPNSMVEKKLDTGDSIIGAKPEISAGMIMKVGQMAMLQFPGIFTGYYVWIWYIFCLGVAIAFWIIIFLAVVRGVGSS